MILLSRGRLSVHRLIPIISFSLSITPSKLTVIYDFALVKQYLAFAYLASLIVTAEIIDCLTLRIFYPTVLKNIAFNLTLAQFNVVSTCIPFSGVVCGRILSSSYINNSLGRFSPVRDTAIDLHKIIFKKTLIKQSYIFIGSLLCFIVVSLIIFSHFFAK
jgi:hypothetical protein